MKKAKCPALREINSQINVIMKQALNKYRQKRVKFVTFECNNANGVHLLSMTVNHRRRPSEFSQEMRSRSVVSIYPHRLLAFSQNVRPGEGSVPTPTTGKLQSLMTSRAEKGTQDLMRWCMIESIFVIWGRLGAESSWVWLSHTFGSLKSSFHLPTSHSPLLTVSQTTKKKSSSSSRSVYLRYVSQQTLKVYFKTTYTKAAPRRGKKEKRKRRSEETLAHEEMWLMLARVLETESVGGLKFFFQEAVVQDCKNLSLENTCMVFLQKLRRDTGKLPLHKKGAAAGEGFVMHTTY